MEIIYCILEITLKPLYNTLYIVTEWPRPDSNRFLWTDKHIKNIFEGHTRTVHFSAVLEYIMTYLELYMVIWENNSEQKWRPSNRLLPREKIILELEQRTNGVTTKRMENLSLAFEKPTANGNTYIFESRHAHLKNYTQEPPPPTTQRKVTFLRTQWGCKTVVIAAVYQLT